MVSARLSKVLLAWLLPLAGATPLLGQQPDTATGPRIEVRFHAPVESSAALVDPDTAAGGSKRILEGAVLGFTVGAVLGGAVVKLSGRSPAPTGGDVIFSGIIYGMMGGALGAAIAAATPAKEPERR